MARTGPMLHFSGRFRFDFPEYNNNPRATAVGFNPSTPVEEVLEMTAGDPAQYFEFAFFEVQVRSVTYRDGSTATAGDTAIGLGVQLSGLLVDIAPSAIVAVLHAGRLSVGTSLRATVDRSYMSELRLSTFMDDPTGGMQAFGAHFEARSSIRNLTPLPGSRWSTELGQVDRVVVRFFINRFCAPGFDTHPPADHRFGDVYGIICADTALEELDGVRLTNRRLLAAPEISDNLVLSEAFGQNAEAAYDVVPDLRLISLHVLECLRFSDKSHGTFVSRGDFSGYDVELTTSSQTHILGSIRGDHPDLVTSGGTYVYASPAGVNPPDDFALALVAIARDGRRLLAMLETEVDLALETARGVYLGSRESTDVAVRVYRRNRPVADAQVGCAAEPQNRRSPIVAGFGQPSIRTDAAGRARVALRALDLDRLPNVVDPVSGGTLTRLPLDRYAGHYANLTVPNPRRDGGIERREVAVRVLHQYGNGHLPIPTAPSFAGDILPVFSLLIRYFPFLHVRPAGGPYQQFLDLADHTQVANSADTILARLELDDTNLRHMPRSRDLPRGFAQVFKQWIDSGMLP